MKKLMTILILILFSTFIMAQDQYVEWAKEFSKKSVAEDGEDYHSMIVKQANEEWKDDYSMIAYEIKNQCKALYEFIYMEKPVDVPEDTFLKITSKAISEWGEFDSDFKLLIKVDWTMVLYVTKEQVKAYLEIF